MTNKAIMSKLYVAILLVGVLGLFGCEGSTDRSLTIEAYPAANQTSDKAKPVMDNVFKVRLGVFEKVGDDYRTDAVYKFENIVKKFVTCTTEYTKELGAWSEITCDSFIDGTRSEGGSPSDAMQTKLVQCQNQYLEQTQSGTISYADCSETDILDGTRINTLDLEDLPASSTKAYTYVIEGFGNLAVESTDCCGNCGGGADASCNEGWECKTNTDNLKVCVRIMSDAVVARGISAPTVYNGDDSQTAEVLFPLVMDFATVSNASGDASLMEVPRLGHKAMLLPDGKVLLIGGETSSSGGATTFPNVGELFNPADNTFSTIDVANWTGGRSFFTFNEIEVADVIDDDGKSTTETAQFLMVGGNTSQGSSSDVYIGTYTIKDQTLTMNKLDVGGFTAVSNHQTTDLGDGKYLITGGKSGQYPVSDAYLLDLNTSRISAVASLSKARFNHSATRMPSGKVVIVGGLDSNGNTTSIVEVYDPETQVFSVPVYDTTTGEDDNSDYVSRAGHIAVPLAKHMPDGSVAEEDYSSARIAIYGGFRFSSEDAKLGTAYYYYNMDTTVIVAFVDDEGKVEQLPWTPNPGYTNAMKYAKTPSPHPCVESNWTWLGNSTDTILVAGGRRDNHTEFSDWAEIIKFVGSDAGYTLGAFEFGTNGPDRVNTPFRTALFSSGGRGDSTLTKLDNGMYLVAGGQTYSSNLAASQTLSSAELFNPPSLNRWGNIFKVLTDF